MLLSRCRTVEVLTILLLFICKVCSENVARLEVQQVPLLLTAHQWVAVAFYPMENNCSECAEHFKSFEKVAEEVLLAGMPVNFGTVNLPRIRHPYIVFFANKQRIEPSFMGLVDKVAIKNWLREKIAAGMSPADENGSFFLAKTNEPLKTIEQPMVLNDDPLKKEAGPIILDKELSERLMKEGGPLALDKGVSKLLKKEAGPIILDKGLSEPLKKEGGPIALNKGVSELLKKEAGLMVLDKGLSEPLKNEDVPIALDKGVSELLKKESGLMVLNKGLSDPLKKEAGPIVLDKRLSEPLKKEIVPIVLEKGFIESLTKEVGPLFLDKEVSEPLKNEDVPIILDKGVSEPLKNKAGPMVLDKGNFRLALDPTSNQLILMVDVGASFNKNEKAILINWIKNSNNTTKNGEAQGVIPMSGADTLGMASNFETYRKKKRKKHKHRKKHKRKHH